MGCHGASCARRGGGCGEGDLNGDSNAKPSGKMRQLQYKLKAGEAGWLLKLDKATEY